MCPREISRASPALPASLIGPDAVEVAGRTYEYFEYLEKLEAGAPHEPGSPFAGNHFGFHIACHQRALGAGSHAINYMKKHGAEVEVIETGTCW